MSSGDDDPLSLAQLSADDRTQALAKYQILRPHFEDGLTLANAIRDHDISLRTARYWVTRYRQHGLLGLARRARSDKAARKLPTPLQHVIEGLALKRPRLSIAAIHRRVCDHARAADCKPPSYGVVVSVVRELNPALVTMAHEGAKAYSDTFDLLHRREAPGPNAVWQADHCLLPIVLLDEQRKPRRPWLTIVLDDYSRAVAGYALFFTAPSSIQTALALRHAIWRKEPAGWQVCGIPDVLYTDHGTDFTSVHIEQVAADLKMRLVFSAVGRPRGRGKIERFFETLSQVFLTRLPGFAPEGVSARPVLTLTQFAAELEGFLIREYLKTPHRSTGVAPQERWHAGSFLPRMPDSLEHLDLLLLTVARTRRVQRDGIRFAGLRYISPTLAAYVGEEVLLRYDPRDAAEVRVFFQDRFLCRAICQELAGETVPLREIVNARARRRRELRQELTDRRRVVDSLMAAKQWVDMTPPDRPTQPPTPSPGGITLKRYWNE